MTSRTPNVNKFRVPSIMMAVFLLAWPLLFGPGAIGRYPANADTITGDTIASILKAMSLLAGGILISLAINSRRLNRGQLWALRILTVAAIYGGLYTIVWFAGSV